MSGIRRSVSGGRGEDRRGNHARGGHMITNISKTSGLTARTKGNRGLFCSGTATGNVNRRKARVNRRQRSDVSRDILGRKSHLQGTLNLNYPRVVLTRSVRRKKARRTHSMNNKVRDRNRRQRSMILPQYWTMH